MHSIKKTAVKPIIATILTSHNQQMLDEKHDGDKLAITFFTVGTGSLLLIFGSS